MHRSHEVFCQLSKCDKLCSERRPWPSATDSGAANMMEVALSLEARMAATREASAKRIPPDAQAIMHAATEQLRGSGALQRVIRPGARAPAFVLDDQNGQAVALASLLAAGAVVLSVFRGFW